MFRLAVRILHYLTLQCSEMDPIRLKSTLILEHQVPVWITSLRLFLSFHGFSFKNRISKCLVIYLKANIIATSTNDFIVIFKATIFRIWTTIKSHFPSTKTNEQFSTNFLEPKHNRNKDISEQIILVSVCYGDNASQPFSKGVVN